jgi:hypothetical protein
MVTVVAAVLFHCNVELCPEMIEVGSAVRVTVGGGTFTVMVTVAVFVPPEPVAVNV